MRSFPYRTGILSVMAAIFLCGGVGDTVKPPAPKDLLKNRAELNLPLTSSKLVIAHCMPNIIRYKGHKLEDSCNPEYFSPSGNISSSLGGLTQVHVLSDSLLANASLDEAVAFDLKAAKQAGIDGFQFYYTLGNDSWDDIIKSYFRVAATNNIDFKFTFCISHPSGSTEMGRIFDYARRINAIMDEVGRDNKRWLRTPDGRLIVYTWYGDNLADIPAVFDGKTAPYYVAQAYEKLANEVKEKFALVISINEQISKEKLNNYLDYFPAVWLWTLPYTDKYIGSMVAAQCKKRNRIFTGSAFPDFYTSKLLKRGTWDMFHHAADAAKAGIKNIERKYIVTGLSYNFRKQFEFAIAQDVPIMNIITWNDYPEGHHFAPEANHNDGFSLLLQHYKSEWKKQTPAFEGKDCMVAFYKKYPHHIQPSPFNIPVVEIEKAGISIITEDSLEVVTILPEKAMITVNKISKEARAGLQSTRFAASPGQVVISLTRNNVEVEKLVCPEWITARPYRTDRLTYTFSNLSAVNHNVLFGNGKFDAGAEYNEEVSGNNSHYYKPPAN